MKTEIGVDNSGVRIDVFLRDHFSQLSRAKLQKLIRDGHCLVDGNIIDQPAFKLWQGQLITIEVPEDPIPLMPMAGELEVVWKDADIAVINKPAGLTVHPCPSCQEETLANRLLAEFPQLALLGGERPGIVHRLDKDTSGLMLVALTERARLALTQVFAERRIHKQYLALVYGVPCECGECREPIGRHPRVKTRMDIVPLKNGGRSAYTNWRLLWHNDIISLIQVSIESGRTHQIRVHMAHCGFPLLGDAVYSPEAVSKLAKRQMLHARKLAFIHPFSGEDMRFCISPPAEFYEAAMQFSQDRCYVVVTGNQGCGKSSFCQELKKLGLPVISADTIVADLYNGRNDASEWIATHIGSECVTAAGSVDKEALFALLQTKPWLKVELEKVIHGMVQQAIEDFWREEKGNNIVVAEIPLYFESGINKRLEISPFVVGISCPKEERYARLASTRGWSREKIETIESWQWPEEKKMQACDAIVINVGNRENLALEARKLIASLEADIKKEKRAFAAKLVDLCQCPDPENEDGKL